MATTVIQAFNEFLKDTVNLDKEETKTARASRDWLVGQIIAFADGDANFPDIYTEQNIFYGSFSKNTKKRPLDDIDIMICLKANGCTYLEYSDRIEITVPQTSTAFDNYVNDNTSILNSRKVVNAFVSKLSKVPQYKNAEIKRNMEAATLSLQSYDWVYDIVPCFFTTTDSYGRTYYIIPDGNGNWKKTDPRIDQTRTSSINSNHSGRILNVIRTVKFWNKRAAVPTMRTYLLENLLLDYYSSQTAIASEFVDIELVKVFYDIHQRVYNPVNDPKNIQGNLNNLSYDEKKTISERAYSDYLKAVEARNLEQAKDYRGSINKWREIFGEAFPKYF